MIPKIKAAAEKAVKELREIPHTESMKKPTEYDEPAITTTEEARQYFKKSGLTYNTVFDNISILRECIKKELKKSKLKMKLSDKFYYEFKNSSRDINCFFLYVNGPYFEDREAVSFNENGYIGFAGWADSENVKPFISGFVKALQQM